jgi:phosphate transport system substrate-binding protein
VKIKRHSAAVGLVAACALALSACGSDVNTPTGQPPASTPNVQCGGKQSLTGEGSTAQANAITQFTAALEAQCPQNKFSYNPTGSGAGITQFTAGQVDIGGSDSPMTPAQVQAATPRCKGNEPLHMPLVFGPIALAYNVAGVQDLVLTPDTIAKIFAGKVTTWNDPEIAGKNQGKNLPSAPIKVFYRSEDSGTTDNFQTFLGDAAPSVWTTGAGKQFTAKVPGAEGRAKSQGVAEAVKSTPNSITYDEASYAQQAGLGIAQVDSGAGPVSLTTQTTAAAVGLAQFKASSNPNDLVVDLKSIYTSKQAGVYPVVLVSYDIVCSKGYDADTTQAVKTFLKVAAGAGQDRLSQAGYVPLPQNMRDKVNTAANSLS